MLPQFKKTEKKADISTKMAFIILASSVVPAVAIGMAVMYIIHAL
ncbi:hypothetical protein [Flavobacterium sp. Sd200]|nr:hypothetical protein [Flavobacterium sp. Sd200]